jgi:hypothetical protein
LVAKCPGTALKPLFDSNLTKQNRSLVHKLAVIFEWISVVYLVQAAGAEHESDDGDCLGKKTL